MGARPRFNADPERERAELEAYLGEDYDLQRLAGSFGHVADERRAIGDDGLFFRNSRACLYSQTLVAMMQLKLPYLRELVRAVPPGSRVLDYGCGIGSDGLVLLEAGYHVAFADFDNPSTRYLRWRLSRRGLQAAVYDLDRDEVPGGFDLVYTFDVLDEVEDPRLLLDRIESLGRLVLVNVVEPEHDEVQPRRRLPAAELLRRAAGRGLVRQRLHHGRSRLVLYRPEATGALHRLRSQAAVRRGPRPRRTLTRPAGSGALPGVIVIGAKKCGTTSLHRYLDLHPEIRMSPHKEPNFFNHHWHRGLDWYRGLFVGHARIHGEASTDYTLDPLERQTPARIRSVVPDVKLIYLVRDPVARVVSDYMHQYAHAQERRPLAAVVADPAFGRSDYVSRGRYAYQLEQYLAQFPMEQILVLDQADLQRDRDAALSRTFAFLGVHEPGEVINGASELNRSADLRRARALTRRSNRLSAVATSSWKWPAPARAVVQRTLTTAVAQPRVDDDLAARIAGHFSDDAERLRELTGQRFGSWRV